MHIWPQPASIRHTWPIIACDNDFETSGSEHLGIYLSSHGPFVLCIATSTASSKRDGVKSKFCRAFGYPHAHNNPKLNRADCFAYARNIQMSSPLRFFALWERAHGGLYLYAVEWARQDVENISCSSLKAVRFNLIIFEKSETRVFVLEISGQRTLVPTLCSRWHFLNFILHRYISLSSSTYFLSFYFDTYNFYFL